MRSGLEGGLVSLADSAMSNTLPFRLFLPDALDAPVKIKNVSIFSRIVYAQ